MSRIPSFQEHDSTKDDQTPKESIIEKLIDREFPAYRLTIINRNNGHGAEDRALDSDENRPTQKKIKTLSASEVEQVEQRRSELRNLPIAKLKLALKKTEKSSFKKKGAPAIITPTALAVTAPTRLKTEYATLYMNLMQQVIEALSISTSHQPAKETIVDWLRRADPSLSGRLASSMATLVRMPEMQKGGYYKGKGDTHLTKRRPGKTKG